MRRQCLTIAEIRSKHSESKRQWDHISPWAHFIQRPLSFYVAWLFLRLGISANSTTLMSFIAGVIGCGFLAIGGYWLIIIGAVFIYICNLLDFVDGDIARCTTHYSRFGRYLDAINDHSIALLMPVAIGIGLYWHPDPYLNHLSYFLTGMKIGNNIVYPVAGVCVSFLRAFNFLIIKEFDLSFPAIPYESYKPGVKSENNIWRLVYSLGSRLSRLIRPIFLVCAFTNILSIFLIFLAVGTLVRFIIVTIRAFILAKALDKTV